MNRDQAFEVLAKAATFSSAHVGFSGETPQTVHAFRHLLRDPDGAQIFRRLLDEASLAGQLYALAGLYLVDPSVFQEAARRYEGRAETVEAMFGGCVIDTCTVTEVVDKISAGGWFVEALKSW